MSPALAGGFCTTEPPGKPDEWLGTTLCNMAREGPGAGDN